MRLRTSFAALAARLSAVRLLTAEFATCKNDPENTVTFNISVPLQNLQTALGTGPNYTWRSCCPTSRQPRTISTHRAGPCPG